MYPKKESMKQRFKRRHPYKYAREITFDDDSTDYGGNAKELRRRYSYRKRGHAGGRKPNWRAKRKARRLCKRDVSSVVEPCRTVATIL